MKTEKTTDSYAHAYELAMASAVSGRRELAVVIQRAWRLIEVSDQMNEETPSGNVKPKTRKRSQIERARLDLMLRVLADWPDYPVGCTTSSVEEALRRLLYRTDAPWEGAKHSLAHRVDVPY